MSSPQADVSAREGSSPLRLAYVTSTVVNDVDAHSQQIARMTAAFADLLGDAFLFLRPQAGKAPDEGVETRLLAAPISSRPIRQLWTAVKAAWVLRRRGPCIFVREAPIAFLLRLAGFRLVVELHTVPRGAAAILLRAAAGWEGFSILAISKALEGDLRRAVGERADIRSYHDGAEPSAYLPLHEEDRRAERSKLSPDPDATLALYTGSLYKGGDALSLLDLARAHPQVRFAIVGGSGERLHDLARQARDAPNVLCLGQQPHETVRRMQQAADILLYPLTRTNPLWRHTSPLKLFEYMAAGGIIVGSNIGSVGEVLSEEIAYVCDWDDPVQRLAAFERALRATPGEIERKRSACRRLVETRYNWRSRAEFIADAWIPPQAARAS